MPQQITCSGCGKTLYDGEILRSPQDVIKKHDGRCPECNKKLDFSPDNLTITPCEKEK